MHMNRNICIRPPPPQNKNKNININKIMHGKRKIPIKCSEFSMYKNFYNYSPDVPERKKQVGRVRRHSRRRRHQPGRVSNLQALTFH